MRAYVKRERKIDVGPNLQVFIYPSLANTSRAFYGDMMFVYALADLAPGDELTTSYASPMDGFAARKEMQRQWGFMCECPLCILDRSEPADAEGRRQELLAQLEKIELVSLLLYRLGCFWWEKKKRNFLLLIRPHVLSSPATANSLASVLAIVREMRHSYKHRKHFHVHLHHPLSLLAVVHRHRGELSCEIDVLREIIDMALTSPLCYIISPPDVCLRLVLYYTFLGDRRLAKKVEHMFFFLPILE